MLISICLFWGIASLLLFLHQRFNNYLKRQKDGFFGTCKKPLQLQELSDPQRREREISIYPGVCALCAFGC
jgi:hypothetical protein